jgi:hypothetical protein
MGVPAIILPRGADPAGLARVARVPDIFDHAPHRNRDQPGIDANVSTPEWDNVLIATACELGCPRWAAEQARTHPPARFALLRVWCDVQDAAEGDGAAKERVDYYRWCFQQQRKDEIISDQPDRVSGHLVDR